MIMRMYALWFLDCALGDSRLLKLVVGVGFKIVSLKTRSIVCSQVIKLLSFSTGRIYIRWSNPRSPSCYRILYIFIRLRLHYIPRCINLRFIMHPILPIFYLTAITILYLLIIMFRSYRIIIKFSLKITLIVIIICIIRFM